MKAMYIISAVKVKGKRIVICLIACNVAAIHHLTNSNFKVQSYFEILNFRELYKWQVHI